MADSLHPKLHSILRTTCPGCGRTEPRDTYHVVLIEEEPHASGRTMRTTTYQHQCGYAWTRTKVVAPKAREADEVAQP